MSFDLGFDQPFTSGTHARSYEVPGRYTASLDGRAYMLDLTKFARRSSPIIRQQADSSTEPGEQSLNPNDLWRRSQSSWHGGAGQEYLDLQDSSRIRFDTSKGLDPWTKGSLSLLSDTEIVAEHSGTSTLITVVAGARLYVASDKTLSYTEDGASFTTVTGTAAFTITTLATDGFNVYIGYGAANPIQATNTGISTAATWNSGAGATAFTADLLGYAKNRLMAATGSTLLNLKTSAASTDLTPLFFPAAWTWTAFTETPGFILAAGYVGDESSIFRITIQPEGTALTQPVAAATTPDSEVILALGYYLGFVLLGTSSGARLATCTDSGAITYGPRIDTAEAVRCFEPQGNHVWFGWSNYDGTSTGLGRMDLATFTLGIRPAYASDLMVTGQGQVNSVSTFLDRRFYAVRGLGIVGEAADKVASGMFTTGQMGYGLTDPKVFSHVSLRHEPLRAGESVLATISVDKNDSSLPLQSGTADTTGFPSAQGTLGNRVGVLAEMTYTLKRATVTSLGPRMTLWTVRAWPVPRRSEEILLPIMLQERVLSLSESEVAVKVVEEFQAIKALEREGRPVTLQLGNETMLVFIDAVELSNTSMVRKKDGLQGLCTVLVRRFE